MSDQNNYSIGSVTITPMPGGYYELSHPGMPEPLRERGKEKAEAKAREIHASFQTDDEGSMSPQGALPPVPPTPPAAPPVQDDEVANLKAQLAASEARRKELEDAAGNQVRTVEVEDGTAEEPEFNRVPASVPRRYDGEMSAKQKKALEKLGVKVQTIILEENSDIPPTGLFLGHNGRGYVIVPGEKVDVPDFLIGVLDDAVMSAPIVDSKSNKVLGYRNRLRYGYRRVE